ncbi:MAG: YraN family protein [Chitinophagaceae bacterium]
MALHNEIGEAGEKMAAAWLQGKGYEILQINWRYSYYEIDIIARKGGTLHIIEVKSRKYFPGAYPEDSVNRKKFKHLQRAAGQYLSLYPQYKWLQYDIVAITLHKYKPAEFFLLQDVFIQ